MRVGRGSERLKARKPPRWVAPFLRALERGGDVRRAAFEVGVDHTTAYNRRKVHADFAAAWAEALRRFAAGEEDRGDSPLSPLAVGGPPSPSRGEGCLVLQPGVDGVRRPYRGLPGPV